MSWLLWIQMGSEIDRLMAEGGIEVKSHTINININGERRKLIVRSGDTLLYIIREKLGLTGAKPGCLNGDCGACTVNLEGWPMKSCLMLAVETDGKKITTIEGLENTPIQQAFVE